MNTEELKHMDSISRITDNDQVGFFEVICSRGTATTCAARTACLNASAYCTVAPL